MRSACREARRQRVLHHARASSYSSAARAPRGCARCRPAGAGPSSVVRIAVGWWAKSSYTVTRLASPRTCMRRRTPPKRASASMPAAGSTPTCCAARQRGQRVHAGCARRAGAIARGPAAFPARRLRSALPHRLAGLPPVATPKRSTGVQHAHGEHSLQRSVRPIGDDSPGLRHSSHEVVKLPSRSPQDRRRCRHDRTRDYSDIAVRGR